eukprot:467292-Ditylum_brightwellii.AAC.1
MMNAQQGIDYRNMYFELPNLSKIHGEPMNGSLLILKNEVKANAMTVPNTLGGGACGHLGLVLAPVQYASIPVTAVYVRPLHPGPLSLSSGMTQYQITQARDYHQETLRNFRE